MSSEFLPAKERYRFFSFFIHSFLHRNDQKDSLHIQQELGSVKKALTEAKGEISSASQRLEKETTEHSQTKTKCEKLVAQLEETKHFLSQSKSECDTLRAQVHVLGQKLNESCRMMEEESQLKDTQIERLKKMNDEEVRRHDEEMKNGLKEMADKYRAKEEGWKKQELDLEEELAKMKQQNAELHAKVSLFLLPLFFSQKIVDDHLFRLSSSNERNLIFRPNIISLFERCVWTLFTFRNFSTIKLRPFPIPTNSALSNGTMRTLTTRGLSPVLSFLVSRPPHPLCGWETSTSTPRVMRTLLGYGWRWMRFVV